MKMTNQEAAALLPILSQLKICVPGSIGPGTADKLIDLTCEVQEAYEQAMKKFGIIRDQTKPEGVSSWTEASEEQRAVWNASMKEPLEVLERKPADVMIEPLTREEFRQLTAANTLTGAQAAFLRRVLVEKPVVAGGTCPSRQKEPAKVGANG